jgi:hypothetical protein
MRRLVVTVSDDASYYLEIARRVVGGNGVSFDGIHPTNGFHPLWESLLILLQAITRAGPESQLRSVLVLQIGLLVMAALWIWRGSEVVAGARGAFVGLVTFLVLGFIPAVSGMESALVWFLLAGFLYRAPLRALHAERTWRRGAEIGAWLGLLALARLDLVFFVPIGLASLSGSALLAGAVVLLLLLGPYLVWNLATFGHLVPISGALKTSFPDPGWYLGSFKLSRLDHTVLVVSLLACFVYGVRRLTMKDRSRQGPLRALSELDLIAIGALLHAGYLLFFMRWAVFGWYLVPERFALVVLVAWAVAEVNGRRIERWMALVPGFATLALAGTLVFAVRRDWKQPLDHSWHVAAYEAAIWARDHLPQEAILAMKDAGHFAFFSERRVINIDGLANNFAYQDELRRGRFAAYLHESGVTYFVQHAFPDSPEVARGEYQSWTFNAFSHLYQVSGGSICVTPRDEVYRSMPYFDGSHRTAFIIFRLPG